MKKFLFLLIFLSCGVLKADNWPTFNTSGFIANTSTGNIQAAAGNFTYVIPAAGVGNGKNCLTNLSYITSASATVAIIDGTLATGTTIFSLTAIAANTPYEKNVVREEAICGSPNVVMTLNSTAGNAMFNFLGYQRTNP